MRASSRAASSRSPRPYRDKGVDELFGLVGDFARKQPAMFIGGAALLGFAASRFAVASAKSAQSGIGPQLGHGDGPEQLGRQPRAASRKSVSRGRAVARSRVRRGGITTARAAPRAPQAPAAAATAARPAPPQATAPARPARVSSYGSTGTNSSGYTSGVGGSTGTGGSSDGTGGSGQWNSTRDTEGGTI